MSHCGDLHLLPEKWLKSKPFPDGRVRCLCPNCKRFKGWIVPQVEQAKKRKAKQ